MPSRAVQLDANGAGLFQFDHDITTLTIINATSSSVNFRWKLGADPVPLAANTQVEFEEQEAGEVAQLVFDSGPASGVLTIAWANEPERVRLG